MKLSPAAGLVAGVEIGRGSIKAVLLTLGHDFVDREDEKLPNGAIEDLAYCLGASMRVLRTLLHRTGHSPEDLFAVGLGLPCPIDREGRISRTLFPRVTDQDPVQLFHAEMPGTRVLVENDATLGALGEHAAGTVDRHAYLVYVKVSLGVGAGIFRNGRPHRGTSGMAGELGHVSIDWQGPGCECGSRGCLQTYIGGQVLLRQAQYILGPPEQSTLTELVALARSTGPNHLGARRIIADAGEKLGIALASVVNFTSPDVIALGGALSSAEELLLEPVRRSLLGHAVPEIGERVTTMTAQMKEWSSAFGGAHLVLRAPFDNEPDHMIAFTR
ncbi:MULTISPECIES: ROK family protein [unclassified Nocardiopsis]|uniref:ROK family protein n=1 Tax=Nocardiopsis TaxID=2013 RepID=UPI00387B294F